MTQSQTESYREGRISAFKEIKTICENKRDKLINQNDSNLFPNSPRQISNDAKVRELAVVINNCKQKIEKTRAYKSKIQ